MIYINDLMWVNLSIYAEKTLKVKITKGTKF